MLAYMDSDVLPASEKLAQGTTMAVEDGTFHQGFSVGCHLLCGENASSGHGFLNGSGILYGYLFFQIVTEQLYLQLISE